MGKLRNPLVIFVALFVLITMLGLALFSFSGLTNQTTTQTMSYGSYLGGQTHLPIGGLFSCDVRVTSGGAVDVYIVTPDEYVNYINGRAYHAVDGGSIIGTTHGSLNLFLSSGSYYFIVAPHGYESSSVSVVLHGGPTIGQLLVIPIAALIIAAVVTLVMRRRRRKRQVAEQSSTVLAPSSTEGQQ